MATPSQPAPRIDPRTITGPDEAYWTYCVIVSALTVFGFPFALLAYYIRYRTLRYRIDDEGVSMQVGWLWKRETYIAYRRIQDIHVTRNLIHRWLGLARIDVLTASGHAGAEMTIEGVRDPDSLRDFLYAKMRGARGEFAPAAEAQSAGSPAASAVGAAHTPAASEAPGIPGGATEALALLHEIRDELRAIRRGASDAGPGVRA